MSCGSAGSFRAALILNGLAGLGGAIYEPAVSPLPAPNCGDCLSCCPQRKHTGAAGGLECSLLLCFAFSCRMSLQFSKLSAPLSCFLESEEKCNKGSKIFALQRHVHFLHFKATLLFLLIGALIGCGLVPQLLDFQASCG